jgi:serine/threonine-protein kinase
MKFCPQCEREYGDSVDDCPEDGSRLVALGSDEDTLVGQNIDERYHIEEKIGEGGMGSVYIATQQPVGRKVAVKVLRRELADDAKAVKRFFHEAKVVSKLRHPNTITLYDFGQSREGLLYIAMEYMAGRSLDQAMEERELGLPTVLEIVEQICQSLSEAHQSGIVHRDLKPENIFIDVVGNRNIVKVLDFGIAKIQGAKANLTLTGMVFGTPAYMSPEQAQGFHIDHRTDIYSLGVLFFELLAGRLPYLGDTAMKMAMAHILEDVPDPRPVSRFHPLPEPLGDLVMAMMAKEPDERPVSVDDVREVVMQVTQQLSTLPPEALYPRPPAVPSSDGDLLASELSSDQNAQMVAVRERIGMAATEPVPETGPQYYSADVFDTSEIYIDVADTAEVEAVPDDAVEEVPALPERRRVLPLLAAGILLISALATGAYLAFQPGRLRHQDTGPSSPLVTSSIPPTPTDQPSRSDELAEPAPDKTVPEATHEEVPTIADLVEVARQVVPVLTEGTGFGAAVQESATSRPTFRPTTRLLAAARTVSWVSDAYFGALSELVSATPPSGPPTVVIDVDTEPDGAAIYLGEQLLCRPTPCQIVLPRSDEEIVLRAERRRRRDTHQRLVADRDQQLQFALAERSRRSEEDGRRRGEEGEDEERGFALVPIDEAESPEPSEEDTGVSSGDEGADSEEEAEEEAPPLELMRPVTISPDEEDDTP